MSLVIITGSSGLVGSESVDFFCKKGFDVIGIDNNLRKFFFGKEILCNYLVWMLKSLSSYISVLHNFGIEKSVSDSQNLLPGSTAVLLETIF